MRLGADLPAKQEGDIESHPLTLQRLAIGGIDGAHRRADALGGAEYVGHAAQAEKLAFQMQAFLRPALHRLTDRQMARRFP
jgi:hypothetical protein